MAAEPPQSSNKHNTLLVVVCLGYTLYKRSVQSSPVQSSPVQFSPLITDSPSVMPPGHYHIVPVRHLSPLLSTASIYLRSCKDNFALYLPSE